ncbi:hypothetical protein GQ44DRAFT_827546 [Phaeosphaeriaceae sp. PMI808]|nr:hypothetical protein GQ44DRAFT_827546 [Phaeosphaeriaceae sp. PMI808]
MCVECNKDGDGTPKWSSMRPARKRYLTFTRQEFINRCILVKDGPSSDDDENWLQLLKWPFPKELEQSVPYQEFCRLTLDEPKTFEFGLPFTAQEFLTLCQEFHEYERHPARKQDDSLRGNLEFKASKFVFCNMVDDLATHKINLQDFLANHIPAKMEHNSTLLLLMASAVGPHTENCVINNRRFHISMFAPDGSRNGRPLGPMSHFQSAVFVRSLQIVDRNTITPKMFDFLSKPHANCEAGTAEASVNLFYTPCCYRRMSECCFIKLLMSCGTVCYFCREDLFEADDDEREFYI